MRHGPRAARASCCSRALLAAREPRRSRSNYALNAHRNAERVLLVDADLARPRLHELFGLPRAPGLADVLQYDLPVSDLVHTIENAVGWLGVLTAGSPYDHAPDLLGSPAFWDLIESEQTRGTTVVLDGPPVLEGTSAPAIASGDQVTTIVVVSADGKRRPLRRSLRSLELVEARVLGARRLRGGEHRCSLAARGARQVTGQRLACRLVAVLALLGIASIGAMTTQQAQAAPTPRALTGIEPSPDLPPVPAPPEPAPPEPSPPSPAPAPAQPPAEPPEPARPQKKKKKKTWTSPGADRGRSKG